MALRLDNGESAQLTTPLTVQTLSYIGAPNEGTNKPTFTSTNYLVNGVDDLTTGLSKMDLNVGSHTHNGANSAQFDHGNLLDLSADDHPQYANLTKAGQVFTQTIGGVNPVNPADFVTLNYLSGLGIVSHTHSGAGSGGNTINVGAGSINTSNVALSSNDIYEGATNSDSGVIYINRVGYAGGTSKYRNTAFYDGKSLEVLGLAVGGGITSVNVQNSRFFVNPNFTFYPVDGVSVAGGAIGKNGQVTCNSLIKSSCRYTTNGSGTISKYNQYNVNDITHPGADKWQTRITFQQPFSSADAYTVVAMSQYIDATNGTFVTSYARNASYVDIVVFNDDDARLENNLDVSVIVVGTLA